MAEGGEQLLHTNVQPFRGGLVYKAHRLVNHSTLGLRVMKNKIRWRKAKGGCVASAPAQADATLSFKPTASAIR